MKKQLAIDHILKQLSRHKNFTQSVQGQSPVGDIDVVIGREWLAIYVVDEERDVEWVEKTFQHNTKLDISTMILVPTLMTAYSHKRDWLNAIQDRQDGRIYTYTTLDVLTVAFFAQRLGSNVLSEPLDFKNVQFGISSKAADAPRDVWSVMFAHFGEGKFWDVEDEPKKKSSRSQYAQPQGNWSKDDQAKSRRESEAKSKEQAEQSRRHKEDAEKRHQQKKQAPPPQQHRAMGDPYVVLGVNRAMPNEAIKKAYRELCKKWHPDANIGVDTTAKMQEINSAYDKINGKR